jgi:hypothetical protein
MLLNVGLRLSLPWWVAFSCRAWSIAVRWAILSSWLFHWMPVSGGSARTRLIVSLVAVSLAGHGSTGTGGALPDLNVAAAIILGPDAEDILAASNAQDGAANLLAGLEELITNHRQ